MKDLIEAKRAIDAVLERLSGSSPYSKLRNCIPVLAKSGFYDSIPNPNPDSYFLYTSILECMGGHSDPSSFGLGLGALAMAATCGQILKAANRTEELSRLIEGDEIFAYAVSEKGWGGKIQNLRTILMPSYSGSYILEGSKHFTTNGREADKFIIVANDSSGFPISILIPRNTEGLEILEFELPWCIEATHAQLVFHKIHVFKDSILDWDYARCGRVLASWERFSLNFLILGLVERILRERPDFVPFDYSQMEKEVFEIRSKLYRKLEQISQVGIESIQLRDTIVFSGLFQNYFMSSDWEKLYEAFGILRKIFFPG